MGVSPATLSLMPAYKELHLTVGRHKVFLLPAKSLIIGVRVNASKLSVFVEVGCAVRTMKIPTCWHFGAHSAPYHGTRGALSRNNYRSYMRLRIIWGHP